MSSRRFIEHVELTVIAVGVGFVIAFALSLLILRAPRTEVRSPGRPGRCTRSRVLPSSRCDPLYRLTVLTGRSARELHAAHPHSQLVRAYGFPARYARRGRMGYAPRDILWRIELPALAVIIAGIRLATISTTARDGHVPHRTGRIRLPHPRGDPALLHDRAHRGRGVVRRARHRGRCPVVLLQRRLTPWARTA